MHRFTLKDTLHGCKDGVAQARALFDRHRAYTFKEMIELGIRPEYVMWLVLPAANDDQALLEKVVKGVRACLDVYGIAHKPIVNQDDCQRDMYEAAKRHMQETGATRDEALHWACAIVMPYVIEGD